MNVYWQIQVSEKNFGNSNNNLTQIPPIPQLLSTPSLGPLPGKLSSGE